MTTKFAIFGFPRCGSTYLCSLLESHPKVLCHYEVFHPEEIVTVYSFKDEVEEFKDYTPQKRDENPREFLDFLFRNNLWGQSVGFKIFIGHSEEAHNLILDDRDIRKILLKRNSIPAYTSMLIAEKTGAFTHKDQNYTGPVKVSLDMEGLVNFHALIDRYFKGLKARLAETGQDYLELTYEQLVSDPAIMDDVFYYIGAEQGRDDIKAFTKKQNEGSLADKIDNIDEVVSDAVRLFYDKEQLVARREAEIAELKRELAQRDLQIAEHELKVAHPSREEQSGCGALEP